MDDVYKVIIKQEDKSHKVINTNAKNFLIKSINGQGPSGLSAYAIALNNGFIGSVEQWIDSLKGDSAYDVALDNGFIGSEEDWLEHLKASIPISSSDEGKILTNDGNDTVWISIEDKLNSEDITWDLGEIS